MPFVKPQPQQTIEGESLAGLKLLLVDSDRDNLVMTMVALRFLKAKIIPALSAQEAMNSLLQEEPDVLVSNLVLPEEDGCALIRQVRRLPYPKFCRIPAIALTACRSDELCERAIAAGFNIYHEIPILSNELAIIIRNLLSFRNEWQEQHAIVLADTEVLARPTDLKSE